MSHYKIHLSLAAALILSACSSSESTSAPAEKVELKATTVSAENVEITLIDLLDGVTSSYCIDIAGGNQDIDIAKGLQAHTCYSYRGEIGTDQKFAASRFATNELYMPDFDVCATAQSLEAGASIGLSPCDGSDLQKISFSKSGTISMMASPELCFTAATDTRFGRSKVHQIKALSLETCSNDLSAYQSWRGRASAD
jgi:hypothetical protein